MSTFHPYGNDDVRIVSDLSRFEYENPFLKAKVRDHENDSISNSDLPSSILHPVTPEKPRKSLLDIAEASMKASRSYDYGDIYQYYMKPSTVSLPLEERNNNREFAPYPESIKDHDIGMPYNQPGALGIPRIPPDQPNFNKDLPPIMETKEYYRNSNWSDNTVYNANDQESLTSKQKQLENMLMKRVMHKPLFKLRSEEIAIGDRTYKHDVVITANFLVYLFEFIIAIIIVSISSVLLTKDDKLGKGIYRYFIADSSISIIISILFMSTIVNFEKRNGSFYCITAFILSMVSFIMAVSTVIPNKDCETKSICQMRKANSGFIIISAFLWLCDLIMFLTTLYISRMNLLQDVNFDYSSEGVQSEFNKPVASNKYSQVDNDLIDPQSGKPLKEYYLNEKGDMYEVNEKMDLRGKNKILVYTV